jgi:hypothetical protein
MRFGTASCVNAMRANPLISLDRRVKIGTHVGATRFRRKLSRPEGMPGANHP